MEDLEPFYPDRMAGRILGMGDVLSFVEKAQEVVSANSPTFEMIYHFIFIVDCLDFVMTLDRCVKKTQKNCRRKL